MHVDVGKLLHVLAHEIRTPAGIAQGYLRMLLDERLSAPADRRRALEQAQQALTRISVLTRESTELADWIETERTSRSNLVVGALVERAVAAAAIAPTPNLEIPAAAANVGIATVDAGALVTAVSALLKATAREMKARVCTIRVRARGDRAVDVLIGPDEQLATLEEGPDALQATPLSLERGGLGLSLVAAAVVLEAHAAIGWTSNDSRTTVGIRFPLNERALQ
jgi:signal transduction histidine kinase